MSVVTQDADEREGLSVLAARELTWKSLLCSLVLITSRGCATAMLAHAPATEASESCDSAWVDGV